MPYSGLRKASITRRRFVFPTVRGSVWILGYALTCRSPYRRERWRSPDGRNLVAPLPEGVRPESHFGATLISFIIHQYHHNHVTQPLLQEELKQLRIVISSGQINRILTENKEVFHAEKAELLTAGLATASYIQTDDTGLGTTGKTAIARRSATNSSPTSRAPTARAD